MARRNDRYNPRFYSRGRDASLHRNDPLRVLRVSMPIRRIVPQRIVLSRQPLSPVVSDRRYWRPEPKALRPLFSTFRLARRIVVRARNDQFPFDVPLGLRFADPSRVSLCTRRAIRRKVLHALGIAGAYGLARGKRGPHSDISCK